MSARQKAYEEPDVQNVDRPTDWRFNRAHLEASSAPRGATPPPIVKVASNTRTVRFVHVFLFHFLVVHNLFEKLVFGVAESRFQNMLSELQTAD